MRIGVVASSVWLRTVLGVCGVCVTGAATLTGLLVVEWWVWLMLGAGLATAIFSLLLTGVVLWSRYGRRFHRFKFRMLLVAVAAIGGLVALFFATGGLGAVVILLLAIAVGHALTRSRPVSS